ncbi:hypothetical protein DFP72DRAFT_1065915 [Ephemerocybe angulata]|uniref:Uncharacterized protein n=1 Tax=Ephemerocybe angulata TaxID=980116 RepID=A0A8H6I489_9AGAR|nr:hypothetical protein DFP72DRAFT_1065915 [Tulosesus angulatus]
MSSSAVQHDVPLRRAPERRTVKNLDPGCLNISDIIDLHGPIQPTVAFGATTTRLAYLASNTPFPPGSRGFLYYHSRPGQRGSAGEIRFRVVDTGSSSDLAADLFASGRDLLDHTGYRLWRIHMLQLYTVRRYDAIRRLLQSQGLIDAAQDREVNKLLSAVNLAKVGRSTILDTVSDTFVIQLPAHTLRLAFLQDEGCVPSNRVAHLLFWSERHGPSDTLQDAPWREYKGYAVVRFELKKAPKNNRFPLVKEGEVVVVLRILKLLDPLGPDGVLFRLPEGGAFVQTRAHRCWSMHLDRAREVGIITPSSLKILEDLYLRESAPLQAPSPSSALQKPALYHSPPGSQESARSPS